VVELLSRASLSFSSAPSARARLAASLAVSEPTWHWAFKSGENQSSDPNGR